MDESWTNTYVGLPYADHGRTRAGCDCWGLVRMVYADRLGVDLPELGDGYTSAADRIDVARLVAGNKYEWQRVQDGSETALDAVLLRIGGYECHVGVVVEPGIMLHVMRGVNAVVERYGGPTWRNRVASLWRYSQQSG